MSVDVAPVAVPVWVGFEEVVGGGEGKYSSAREERLLEGKKRWVGEHKQWSNEERKKYSCSSILKAPNEYICRWEEREKATSRGGWATRIFINNGQVLRDIHPHPHTLCVQGTESGKEVARRDLEICNPLNPP